MKRRQWGVPMLLSGLVAAQVSFFSSVGEYLFWMPALFFVFFQTYEMIGVT